MMISPVSIHIKAIQVLIVRGLSIAQGIPILVIFVTMTET